MYPDANQAFVGEGRPTRVGGHTLEYNDRSLLTKVSTPVGPSTSFATTPRS
ncbi:hypothetical protein [Nonomuraea turcica]|uniref:hypothetical protein n=1 Tax=Nonomuraea sp. G32 TaxID=3067274 RepID=UPI00273C62B3|nr:hypothetical protein [Nonomuraea sp. G32]MDP4512127.1 hypothetical protein [Nonomuraea sp. G32]